MIFKKGMIVEYNGMTGKVNFIGSTYITITIGESEERLRNVDIVVSPSEYDQIKIH